MGLCGSWVSRHAVVSVLPWDIGRRLTAIGFFPGMVTREIKAESNYNVVDDVERFLRDDSIQGDLR